MFQSRPVNWSIALSIVAMFFFQSSIDQCAKASTNSLKVGPLALVPDGTLLPINCPQHLNYMMRADVLQLRVNMVMSCQALINTPYSPTAAVFDEMLDGKPWWGMAGQYIWGEGKRSIEGPAEESRFVLNPFLLVAANPWTARIWNPEQITDDDLKNNDFPYTWMPQELRYWPRRRMAQVTYDVTAFNGKLKDMDSKLERTGDNLRFGLVAYNARDFGYNFLYLSPNLSSNIENAHKGEVSVEIKQYIHTGDSSKYPGGCNNMSPRMDEIDKLDIKTLPARATILLWKKRPPALTDPADFSFVLDFK